MPKAVASHRQAIQCLDLLPISQTLRIRSSTRGPRKRVPVKVWDVYSLTAPQGAEHEVAPLSGAGHSSPRYGCKRSTVHTVPFRTFCNGSRDHRGRGGTNFALYADGGQGRAPRRNLELQQATTCTPQNRKLRVYEGEELGSVSVAVCGSRLPFRRSKSYCASGAKVRYATRLRPCTKQ